MSPYFTSLCQVAHLHQKPKEVQPLFTTKILDFDRKRLPQPPRKKRTRPAPVTPALSFDPKQNRIRSGRQDPAPPTPTSSCITPSDSSNGGSYEEPSAFTFSGAPQEAHYAFQHQPVYDSAPHKRPRVFSGPTHSYSGTSSTEMNSNLAEYDSPLSCTSSSSPATSDQSPTHFSDNVGCDGFNCQLQPTPEVLCPSYSYSNAAYGGVSNETQLYTRDPGVLPYPIPYHEPNYAGVTPNTAPPRNWPPPS